MTAIWYRARTELAHRWRTTLGLALLVTVVGGIVLAVAVGIRRNATAIDRMVTETHSSDVLVTPNQGVTSKLEPAAIRRLSPVENFSVVAGLRLTPDVTGHRPDLTSSSSTEVLAATDRAFLYRTTAPKLLSGRRPHPSRPREALVNEEFARQWHIGVGSRVTLTPADAGAGRPTTVVVTGIGRFATEVIDADRFNPARMFLTPAFYAAHRDTTEYWAGLATLRRGEDDVVGFERAVRQLVPSERVAFATTGAELSLVHRDTCPVSSTLLCFAAVFGGLGLLLVGQLVGRTQRARAHEVAVLRALGVSNNQQYVIAMAVPVVGLLIGTVLAVGVAVGLSPLFPLGTAARAELHPGYAVNGAWLAAGAGIMVVVLFEVSTLVTWNLVARVHRPSPTSRPSRFAGALQRAGLPLPAVYGTRRALENRAGTGRPTRTGLVGATVGVMGIVLALVFVTNLASLLDHPGRFGWTWDWMVQTDHAANSRATTRLTEHLSGERQVAGVSIGVPATFRVDGRTVPGIGFRPSARPVLPTIAKGRLPAGLGEIALGGRTMRHLHLHLGDLVSVGLAGRAATQPMEVVGQVVLPTLGVTEASDNTDLGVGALVRIPSGNLAPSPALDALGSTFATGTVIRFRSGTSDTARAATLRPFHDQIASHDWALIRHTERPSDIVGLSRVGDTPLVLASVLAFLILGSIAFALVASLRARRRELAILKSLGFVHRQLAGVVAWEATTLAVISAVAGTVLGVAAGRWAWLIFVGEMGISRTTSVPVALLVAVVACTLLVANLAAVLPARAAARTPAAAILRGE